MSAPDVPEHVLALLRTHIESCEQLEILLWLRLHASKPWSPGDVATSLHLPPHIADDALRVLCRRGFLSVEVSPEALVFRYQPGTAELSATVDHLVDVYPNQRVGILKLMNAGAIERLKARALSTFANALPFRRKKDGGG